MRHIALCTIKDADIAEHYKFELCELLNFVSPRQIVLLKDSIGPVRYEIKLPTNLCNQNHEQKEERIVCG